MPDTCDREEESSKSQVRCTGRISPLFSFLLDLNEEERAELPAFVNNHDSDSDSGDELDDGNLQLLYTDARDLNGQVEIMFHQHRMTIAQTILGVQVPSVFSMRQSHLRSVSTFSTQNKSLEIW